MTIGAKFGFEVHQQLQALHHGDPSEHIKTSVIHQHGSTV